MQGFIVVGKHGAMGQSVRTGPGLYFACKQGPANVATVFATRKAAQRAIRVTEERRAAEYPHEQPWLSMFVVRLKEAR